jgi:Peptidase family M23/PKD domain
MRRRKLIAAVVAISASLVVVAAAVAAPTASFTFSPSSATPAEQVVFTSTSTASPGRIANYAWDLDGDRTFGEPGEPAGATATTAARSFAAVGDHVVRLRVIDDAGRQDVASRVVTVREVPPPPPPLPPPTARPLPPPVKGDGDRDGARDRRDRCPGTPPSTKPLRLGCSLTDVMVAPASLIEGATDSLAEARAGVREMRALRRRGRGPMKQLAHGLGKLRTSARKLDSSPCKAAAGARIALRKAGSGMRGIAKLVTAEQRAAIRRASRPILRNPALAGDSGQLDVVYHSLAQRRQLVREALVELRALGKLMRRACDASDGPRSLTARVVSVDPGGSYAKLVGGRTLVLGGAKETRGLAPGVIMRARGLTVKGGSFVAGSASAEGVKTAPGLQCTFTTRIAPVQDFSQPNANIFYHDERGYRDGVSYQLEHGMGIGAIRGPGCTVKDDYELSVRLAYRDSAGDMQNRLIGLLGGFLGGETPARIPLDVDPNKLAKLQFELTGQDCEQKGDIPLCTSVDVLSKKVFTALVKARGGWGKAVYNRDFFSVEDGSKTDFDTATLKDVEAPDLPGATISGVGYRLVAGGSSYPQIAVVLEGEQFAVHDDVPSAADPGGLFWAYVNGVRNGHPYDYTATLPDLYTDVVDYCPATGSGPSVHRLPWKADTLEAVTQGNLTPDTQDNITHTGEHKYAFDFRMDALTVGYATRGGVVTYVEETLTANGNPKAVGLLDPITLKEIVALPGNLLRIDHDDGTYSTYVHMVKDGVYPKKDDRVERGDPVIKVGETGNATGPHLHWDWRDSADPYAPTLLTRFELAYFFDPNVAVQCIVPTKGGWVSTNEKPAG